MDSRDVAAALAEATRTLAEHADRDWSVPAGTLEWDCRATAAHIAHDLLAYAGQVTAMPSDAYLPMDLTVRPAAAPRDVLRIVTAAAGLLIAALDAAGPGMRAWHWGACDAAGFAAMGVAEILLHTHDITAGLGIRWQPPAPLCAAVLERLFPDAPPGDPVPVLLWLTGRGELPGRDRRTSWTWTAARTT
ncbi:hypothetical protein POF50_017525 [Streptomyces sp. SL13]|uniref:Mycothiol-dependent maleylpyruvate isomerase metal-binding domain-containing protein n=1 Tax=Streptantibioticus silvisoli TaxID=2705255 RepID=A0AA90H0N6_9ACTN|nr:maleylpyruvate isomerase N-terminal domain-containing protein [Streptantibioticus silvisoli]MDI5971124.1 hypothetical protein [Streptantibioticus silvisoli]